MPCPEVYWGQAAAGTDRTWQDRPLPAGTIVVAVQSGRPVQNG